MKIVAGVEVTIDDASRPYEAYTGDVQEFRA